MAGLGRAGNRFSLNRAASKANLYQIDTGNSPAKSARMKPNEKQIPLSFILALIVVGCSPSSSIVRDAEKAFRTVVDSESKGQIKLVSFTKKDGRKIEVAGVQGYELLYDAEIKFESDGTWITSATVESEVGFNFEVLTALVQRALQQIC